MNLLIDVIKCLAYFVSLYFYEWLASFSHELGHFIVGKAYRVDSKMLFTYGRHRIPVGKVRYRLKSNFTKKQDLVISSAGVLTALTLDIICLFLFKECTAAALTMIMIIPKILFSFIPVKGNDGYYIINRLVEKEENYYKAKSFLFIIVLFFSIVSVGVWAIVFMNSFDKRSALDIVAAITSLIFFVTYIRFFIKISFYLDDEKVRGYETKVCN